MELEIFVGIYFAIVSIILFLISVLTKRQSGKIQARIKNPFLEKKVWRKPLDDGKTLIMRKEDKKKGIPMWKATFTNMSLVPIKSMGRRALAIDILYESPRAIDYDFKAGECIPYGLSFEDVNRFVTAKALLVRGEVKKQPTSFLEIIMLFGVFMSVLLLLFIIIKTGMLG